MTTTVKTMTPAQIEREIKRRNKLFEKATPAQKRVLIAKDVLDQIKAQRVQPKQSYFVRIPEVADHTHGKDFRNAFLGKALPYCETCAVGGLMLSCTLFNDQHTVGDDALGHELGYYIRNGESSALKNGFLEIFDQRQLCLIEQAFEMGHGEIASPFTDPLDWRHPSEAAIAFGKKYKTTKGRLIGIMKNIIDNKGTFKP